MKEVDLCSLIKAARNGNLFGRYEIVFNYPAICAFLGNLDREEFIYLCGFLDELPPIDPRIVENFLISSFAQKPVQKCTTEPPAEPPADAAQAEKPAAKPAPAPEPIVDIHEVPCYDAQGADDEETEPLDGWDDDGATAVAPAPAEGAQADADDDWEL